MSTIGSNMPSHAGGCGGGLPAPAAAAMPAPGGFYGGGFAIPAIGTAMAAPIGQPERFVSSMSGGVILDKDGAPAGRIPAGAFVDTKNGSIFGADGKAITIPEGSTVDFFDLPDIKTLMDDAKNAAAFAERQNAMMNAMGGGTKGTGPDSKSMADHMNMMQSFVDGQWGPGGVTTLKGGSKPEDCGMEHGAPAAKGGGATGTAATGATSAVAGASGGGATSATAPAPTGNAQLDAINKQIFDLMEQVRRLTPATSTSGGGATLVASTGAAQLGSIDLLRLSVNDLVGAVGQLNHELAHLNIRGGGPGQRPIQFPGAPPKVEAPKTEPPAAKPPVVEPPKTEVPKTDSSSSGSGTSDTRAEASSGSSSS